MLSGYGARARARRREIGSTSWRLIDAYESEHHLIDPPDPIEAIKSGWRLVVSLGFAPAKDAEAGKTNAQQRK